MSSRRYIVNATVVAGMWATICAAVPLTTSDNPSIFQQIHNLSSLHIHPNELTFTENVQREINYINNTSIVPKHHGKAELFDVAGLAYEEGVYPLRATECRALSVSMTDPPFSFVQADNHETESWTQWAEPERRHGRGPCKIGGFKTYVYRWEELQALMSLEEADRRLKATGYHQRIVLWDAMKAGKNEATAKLGYWFLLLDEPVDIWKQGMVLVNARSGIVTREHQKWG